MVSNLLRTRSERRGGAHRCISPLSNSMRVLPSAISSATVPAPRILCVTRIPTEGRAGPGSCAASTSFSERAGFGSLVAAASFSLAPAHVLDERRCCSPTGGGAATALPEVAPAELLACGLARGILPGRSEVPLRLAVRFADEEQRRSSRSVSAMDFRRALLRSALLSVESSAHESRSTEASANESRSMLPRDVASPDEAASCSSSCECCWVIRPSVRGVRGSAPAQPSSCSRERKAASRRSCGESSSDASASAAGCRPC